MILHLSVWLALATLVDLLSRRASAAMRHLLWTLAILGALLIPVASLYTPNIVGASFTIPVSALSNPALEPARFPWLIAIYATGLALMLIKLILDILAANRLVRTAQPSALPGVLVSERAIVPFAWTRIVIPSGLPITAPVIAHETAHIARHDMWTTLLSRLACSIYWFHPLVWWAAYRLRLEADRACDDAVLRAGFLDTDYAAELLALARSLHSSTLAPGAIRPSQLQPRLQHILSTEANRSRLGFTTAFTTAALATALVIPVSALATPDPTIYRVGNGVAPPRVISKIQPIYTRQARLAKLSGKVTLAIVVGTDGQARDIRVVQSLDPGLDASAIAAVKNWKFQPATKAGRPVNVKANIEINFKLL